MQHPTSAHARGVATITHDGTVLDGAVHVVDIYVVTEDLARIAVPLLERGTGKRQHGGIRQRIA